MISSGCSHSDKRHLCGGCAQVSYCSAECATRHWEDAHQWECIAGKREKPDTPEEEEFLEAMKMLKGDGEPEDSIQIVPVESDPIDKLFETLNFDKQTYDEITSITRGIHPTPHQQRLLLSAVEKYFNGHPKVKIDRYAYFFMMAIKRHEKIYESKKIIALAQVMNEFNIDETMARKKLNLPDIGIRPHNSYIFQIKDIWLAFLKYYGYNTLYARQEVQKLIDSKKIIDILKRRKEQVLDITKRWTDKDINTLFESYSDLMGKYPLYNHIRQALRDATRRGPNKTEMERFLGGTFPRVIYEKMPYDLLPHARTFFDQQILKKRKEDFNERVFNQWLYPRSEEDKQQIVKYLETIFNSAYFTNPRRQLTRDELFQVYKGLFDKIKTEHPEWIKIKN